MLFDSTILCRIAADLQTAAIGARVQRVLALGRETIALDLARRLPRPQLLLSCDAQFGRALLTDAAVPTVGERFPFCDVLRRYLRGATIAAVEQVAYDRLVRVEFANAEGLGPNSRCALVAEIMGKRGNLLLLDADGVILDCARHVPPRLNRYRTSLPGAPYVLPPGMDRLQPKDVTADRLTTLAGEADPDEPLGRWLRSVVMGGSDLFVAEVCARAGLSAQDRVDDLPTGGAQALAEALRGAAQEAAGGAEAYVYAGAGELFAYPLALISTPDRRRTVAGNMSAALEQVQARLGRHQELEHRRQRLAAIARAAREKALRALNERQAALARSEDAESLRRVGELILSNLHAIPPGATRAQLTDFSQPEMPQVTVELDPKRSPQEVAQAHFARYRRAKRAAEIIPGLLRAAQARQDYLDDVLGQIQEATAPDALNALEEELIAEGLTKPPARRKPVPTRRELHRASFGGYSIIYGRSGTQNDAVLHQADAEDIWLHVRHGPGGHVVIRTAGDPERVPPEVLEAAASHAAALCAAREQDAVEVVHTLVKHVRRVRGGPPGFVTYTDYASLVVRPRRLPEKGAS